MNKCTTFVAHIGDNPSVAERSFLTHNEASSFLQISPKTLYKYACEGRLTYYKIGGRNRYKREDLLTLVEACTPSVTRVQKAVNAHIMGQNKAA